MATPTSSELREFEPLVKSVAYKFGKLNGVADQEDLIQEIFWTITLNWDKILEIPKEERFKFVKVMAKNAIYYEIRRWSTRPDSSEYAKFVDEEDEQGHSLNHEYENDFSHGSSFDSPEEEYFGKELLDLLKEYAKKLQGKEKEFVEMIISPSQEIQDWWEGECQRVAKYRHYKTIPPFTVAQKVFGNSKMAYGMMDGMKKFLLANGYA